CSRQQHDIDHGLRLCGGTFRVHLRGRCLHSLPLAGDIRVAFFHVPMCPWCSEENPLPQRTRSITKESQPVHPPEYGACIVTEFATLNIEGKFQSDRTKALIIPHLDPWDSPMGRIE